jgi:hypothetical protein
MENVITAATGNAKDFISSIPIFFFGLSRQGKSTCINDQLELLGREDRPAPEDFIGPCTKGVKPHTHLVDKWTGCGFPENLLFLDTEGWEFGKESSPLLRQCMEYAETHHIQKEILKHRLIFVLCMSAESRGTMKDEKFLGLVKKLCKDASKLAKFHRPVLVPVVTKIDTLKEEQLHITKVHQHFKSCLEEAVGDCVDLRPPILTSSKEHGSTGQRCLHAELRRVSLEQFDKQAILMETRKMISRDLQKDHNCHSASMPPTVWPLK